MQTAATVEKAIEVLFELHAASEPMGVTRLGQALRLPKSSTHRLLTALARRQLVERDARGRYRPGMGLIALGLGSLRADPLVLAARPVLERESDALGETAFLVGVRGGELIVLDKVEGRGFLRAAPTLGTKIPRDGTAVGKLLRAHADAASDPCPETVQVRRLGYAENHAEWLPGLAVVAAPIGTDDRMQGALAIAAPLGQMEAIGFTKAGCRAARAAADIERRLRGDTQ